MTAGLGFVKLWDTRSLALRRALPVRGLALRAVLSRDGGYIAAGTSSGLRVWDARTGRPTEHVPGRDTFAVAFDPRKDLLAFGGADHRVRLLDAVSGRILRTVVTIPDARVLGVAFSADGSHLAAGASDGIARTWSSRSWRSTGHFHGHRCCVTDVAFNPDGSLLATTSKDHTAKLWATRGNSLRVLVGPHGPVTGLAFTRDGRRVAVANAGGPTVLWSIERHASPLPLPRAGHGQALALSGDAALLAVGVPGGRVRLLDARRRTVIRTLHVGHHVTSVAFDARADALGVTSGTTVAGYSTASGRPFIERKIGDATLAIAFRPHRDAVALAAANGGTENGRIYLANLPSGHVTGVLSEPNRIRAIAFSPDGSLLVGATEADTAVKVWDVTTHREIRELFGHVGRVTSAAFSPDGRLLATASVDRTVRIWDVRRGLELRAIRDPAPLTSVAFDPNGLKVASGDADGTVRIWDACSGCLDPHALLALAARRVTRRLTPLERTTFLGTAHR